MKFTIPEPQREAVAVYECEKCGTRRVPLRRTASGLTHDKPVEACGQCSVSVSTMDSHP